VSGKITSGKAMGGIETGAFEIGGMFTLGRTIGLIGQGPGTTTPFTVTVEVVTPFTVRDWHVVVTPFSVNIVPEELEEDELELELELDEEPELDEEIEMVDLERELEAPAA
jgi:hypothetical protein